MSVTLPGPCAVYPYIQVNDAVHSNFSFEDMELVQEENVKDIN